MRTKNFLITLCCVVAFSLALIIFGQHKPETFQNIVTTTHQQIRNFKVCKQKSLFECTKHCLISSIYYFLGQFT